MRGISDSCRAFATPVTGGNVSFYNEGPRGAIDPTPVIGMIGLIKKQSTVHSPQSTVTHFLTASFKNEGDAVILFGETKEELGGSEYLAVVHGRKQGRPPRIDLKQERALQQVMIEAAGRGWLASAHDCSEGGLAVTLAESCMMDDNHLMGASVSPQSTVHSPQPIRPDALLFGESAGRIIVSCERRCVEAVLALAQRRRVPAAVIGYVGGPRLSIVPWIDVPIDELSAAWRSGLTAALEAEGSRAQRRSG